MKTTVSKLLTELEKPENERQIERLEQFKAIDNGLLELDNLNIIARFFAKSMVFLIRKRLDAFRALSECKNVADITAFKQSTHYDKIKSSEVSVNFEIEI